MLFQRLIKGPGQTGNVLLTSQTSYWRIELCLFFSLQRVGEKPACPKISTTAITAMLCSPTPKTHPPPDEAVSPAPSGETAVSLQEDNCD